VLQEFEQKKKELQTQARPYKGSKAAATIAKDSLVGVEQMLRELHKRNETIKKKEMDTKKLYHKYIDKYATKGPKTRAQEDEERLKERFVKTKSEQDRKIKSTTDIVRQVDLPGKGKKELTKVADTTVNSPVRRGSKVTSTVKNLETTAKSIGADASAPMTPGTTGVHISSLSPRSKSKSFKERTAQRQRENKGVYDDYQKTHENVMERARAKAFESEIAGMKEEALLRQRNEFSDEDSSDMVTGTREPPDIDDMSYMTEDERLEDMLKKDMARFEFDADDLASLGSNTETSYAREQKQILDDLEQATKEMEYMASDIGSVTSNETWYAYWSEEHQREYYYETHSRRVVWDKPDKYISADTISDDGSIGGSSTGSAGSTRRSMARVSSAGNLPTLQESQEYRGDSASTKLKSSARSIHDDGSVGNRGSAQSVGSSATYDTYQSNWSANDFMEDGRNARRASYSLKAEKIRRRRRKRLIRRTLWTVALLCMVLGGVYYYQNKEKVETIIANWYGAAIGDGNSHGEKQRREQEILGVSKEDEERVRVEQEEKVKMEKAEKQRQAEEERKNEDEKQRKEAEDNQRKIKEEKRQIEEEKQRQIEEEKQRKIEEEKQRQIEEEKQRKIDDKRRREEKKRLLEEKRKEEEERQRKIEEEKQRKLEEQRKKEEERQRKIEEKKRKEEERLRLLEEQRKKEEERLRLLEEKRKKEQEELEKQRVLEEKKRKEEERLRALEEKKRKEEEALEKRRVLEEKRRKEAEALEKKILEAKRLQEEERLRMKLEQKRRKDTRHDTKNEEGGLLSYFMGSDGTTIAEVPEERPRQCLIPFIHLLSERCRRLAQERPVFDLNELVDSMMQ